MHIVLVVLLLGRLAEGLADVSLRERSGILTEEQENKQKKRVRFTRDTAILAFAISAAAFEITLGGARPSVLTFLTGVFLSPLVIRVDERSKGDE